MGYIDLYVISVPRKNLTAYKKQATLFGKVALDYGALHYREFIQDDMWGNEGKNFLKMVRPKKGEVVIAALTEFKSKKQRDSIMKKLMKDERLAKTLNEPALFNSKKMSYGGFKSIVDEE